MGHKSWVRVVLVVVFGLACFAAGAWLVRPPAPPPVLAADAGPVVLVDAAGIELLPDASLELKLPRPPDVPDR